MIDKEKLGKLRISLHEDCCDCQTFTCSCIPSIDFKIDGRGGYGHAVWVRDTETDREYYHGEFLGREFQAQNKCALEKNVQSILDDQNKHNAGHRRNEREKRSE
jgi:hypothetical protein